MVTCQELVELRQTAFKMMLTAFWSLALPKTICKYLYNIYYIDPNQNFRPSYLPEKDFYERFSIHHLILADLGADSQTT